MYLVLKSHFHNWSALNLCIQNMFRIKEVPPTPSSVSSTEEFSSHTKKRKEISHTQFFECGWKQQKGVNGRQIRTSLHQNRHPYLICAAQSLLPAHTHPWGQRPFMFPLISSLVHILNGKRASCNTSYQCAWVRAQALTHRDPTWGLSPVPPPAPQVADQCTTTGLSQLKKQASFLWFNYIKFCLEFSP